MSLGIVGREQLCQFRIGLPRFERTDLWHLTNATQLSSDIVDFEPIVLKDVDGNSHIFESENLARDYWMIAKLLKERPEIARQATIRQPYISISTIHLD